MASATLWALQAVGIRPCLEVWRYRFWLGAVISQRWQQLSLERLYLLGTIVQSKQ